MLGTGWKKFAAMPLGNQALLGLGAAGVTLPFMAEEEEEIIENLSCQTHNHGCLG